MSTASYKLSIPSARDRDQVPRQRLVPALGARPAELPLPWLVGMPGAGKTSATAQWVETAQAACERCLW